MQQLRFVVVAKYAITSFSSITQQKKAWRKSLRHAPIKENLIVKIEISYSSLVLCILRINVGPTAHPVVAAIEGSDVAYGVETCPAGETCGAEQWGTVFDHLYHCRIRITPFHCGNGHLLQLLFIRLQRNHLVCVLRLNPVNFLSLISYIVDI